MARRRRDIDPPVWPRPPERVEGRGRVPVVRVHCRLMVDGTWTVTVSAFVGGVYRVERYPGLVDLPGGCRSSVESFLIKHRAR